MADLTEDSQDEQLSRLAKIEARKAAFEKSPVIFTIWDITTSFLQVICYVLIFALFAQCSCDGCIWQPMGSGN